MASLLSERSSSLHLEGYARLFRVLSGGAGDMMLCEDGGIPVWSGNGGHEATAAEAAWWENLQAVPTPEKSGMLRQSFHDGTVLTVRPLVTAAQERIGWLVVLFRGPGGRPSDLDPEVLDGAIDDIGACIEREYSLSAELDGIAIELSERYEELNLVYGLADHVRNYDDVEGFLKQVLQTCVEHLDLDAAAIIDHAGERTVVAESPGRNIPNLDLVVTELRGSIFHFATAKGEAVVLNDRDEPRRAYLLPNLPYKVVATRIRAEGDDGYMLVALNHGEKRDFANSDRTLLRLIGDQTSMVLRIQGVLRQLRRFTRQMAAALISAVEAKDAYTRGHSERVHRLSVKLGETLGLQGEELEELFWGSLLHDVGKIGVPDAILGKPGRLTEDEFTFIKIHPERSYEILAPIEYIKEGKLAARHHQEKYDGTGYPSGLKGKNIPLLARITAVADTYDAMTSSRAYRVGCTQEEAVAEIRRVRGSQLDPDLVDLFLELCRTEPGWLDEATRSEGRSDG